MSGSVQRWLQRLRWRLRPPVLALGGGGARGFAHLGLLEVMEGRTLTPRGIVGTSAGAVIGAMYLAYDSMNAVTQRWRQAFDRKLIPDVGVVGSVDEEGAKEHPLLQAARKIRDRVVISLAVNRSTMMDGEDLQEALDFLVPDLEIDQLRLPFTAVATDLETGEEVRLSHGSLREAVRASSSIPGVVPAVRIGRRLLVDGGVVAEVPVAAAVALGRPVVAVDVSMELPAYREDRLVLDTMMRTQLMTSARLRRFQLAAADRVIRPDLGPVSWSEWDRFDELVELGRAAGDKL